MPAGGNDLSNPVRNAPLPRPLSRMRERGENGKCCKRPSFPASGREKRPGPPFVVFFCPGVAGRRRPCATGATGRQCVAPAPFRQRKRGTTRRLHSLSFFVPVTRAGGVLLPSPARAGESGEFVCRDDCELSSATMCCLFLSRWARADAVLSLVPATEWVPVLLSPAGENGFLPSPACGRGAGGEGALCPKGDTANWIGGGITNWRLHPAAMTFGKLAPTSTLPRSQPPNNTKP